MGSGAIFDEEEVTVVILSAIRKYCTSEIRKEGR